MRVRALSPDQAKQFATDEYRGTIPDDFEVLPDDHDYKVEPYPRPQLSLVVPSLNMTSGTSFTLADSGKRTERTQRTG